MAADTPNNSPPIPQRMTDFLTSALDAMQQPRTGTSPVRSFASRFFVSSSRPGASNGLNPEASEYVPVPSTAVHMSPRLTRFDDPHIRFGSIFNDIKHAIVCSTPMNTRFPQTFRDFKGMEFIPAELQSPVRVRRMNTNSRLMNFRDSAKEEDIVPADIPNAVMLCQIDERDTAATTPRNLRYIPLRPALAPDKQVDFTSLRLTRAAKADLDATQPQIPQSKTHIWPANVLPIEIFELVTSFLDRQDVKTLRLVNHEFEEKVARSLFQTSVVPFNTELYDMVDEDFKQIAANVQAYRDHLQAGQPVTDFKPNAMLQWRNENADVDGKLYKGHGLKVFQGFGRYIRRFGLSFEVSEEFLAEPPVKQELDNIHSYFGDYDWPSDFYNRFAPLAGLERVADETSRMRAAFATLESVRELALSIDSGCGWLCGPDKSAYSQVFKKPSSIFRSERRDGDAKEFWRALESSYRACTDRVVPFAEHNLAFAPLSTTVRQLPGLKGTRYANTALWPKVKADRHGKLFGDDHQAGSGIAYLTSDFPPSPAWFKGVVHPGHLRHEQIEWLLETEWAQRAFLESYVLSIVDNPQIFSNVTTLGLVKISSGLLSRLFTPRFWDTLTSLYDVTVKLSVDWRHIERDSAGVLRECVKSPEDAYKDLLTLVTTYIQNNSSITKLHLGYTDGGEHAEGMFARNAHIMPAPLTDVDRAQHPWAELELNLQYVQDFTLSNCWVAPNVLLIFVREHGNHALKRLCLHSVSLTVYPDLSAMEQVFKMQTNPAWAPAVQAQEPTIDLPASFVASTQLSQAEDDRSQNTGTTDFSNILWTHDHRADSWQVMLNNIAPGENFVHFKSTTADPAWKTGNPDAKTTNLRIIDLQSVGYATIPGGAEETHGQRRDERVERSPWFEVRHSILSQAMMRKRFDGFGEIVQHVSNAEKSTLDYAWGLQHGWTDREAAEAVTFDGKQIGGSGRFSGIIQRLQI